MHELTLAMQIQQTVLRAAAQHEVDKVIEVDIEIGELSLFSPGQVEFWLHQLFRDTLAEGAVISVAAIPTLIKCAECGYEGGMRVPTDSEFHIFMPALRCPRCESSQVTVQHGREVIIKNLRVQKAPPPAATA